MRRSFFHQQFVSVALLLVVLASSANAIRRCAGQEAKARPEPQWVDPIQTEPTGTKYGTFSSPTLKDKVSYLVYLPPKYEEQAKEHYPVIYWLHGLGGNQRGGTGTFLPRVDEAIRASKLPPAIVVFVNGMVNSFYCDWVDNKRPMESVIIKDLIPHIDQTYRTIAKREGRLIQGFSMGGFGAGHLGFKYPELFGAVAIDAGALIGEIALNGPNLSPIFQGAFAGDKDRFLAEHPTQLATKNADQLRGKTQIRIGCGQDDNLLARNRELHDLLTQLKIEHQYEVVPGVGHNAGNYYTELGPKCLEFHRQVLEKQVEKK